MAPPTLVFGKEELKDIWERTKGPCSLKALVQNECEFIGHEYVCIPFKRLFKECGAGREFTRIEVTNPGTNLRYADDTISRFWDSNRNCT
ncbi:LAQU0S03e09670g1_1 [Lachancea quebecensis]|uniref:LAQU0S03e09670g1_1 n=1 Tax=Lachancea quebecensis TaxID=1654605 RepID=A0A0P1KPM6_9SACH|nr:LAQU0S03e09670g1_1 [Lachancea quebecensis]